MSDDTKLNAAARKVVISNWFDVSLVRVRVARGVINLQGHIQKTTDGAADLKQVEASLKRMDGEFRQLRGFRGIAYLLDNWIREPAGGWRFAGPRVEREKDRKRR